jgi:hypothetical protein
MYTVFPKFQLKHGQMILLRFLLFGLEIVLSEKPLDFTVLNKICIKGSKLYFQRKKP